MKYFTFNSVNADRVDLPETVKKIVDEQENCVVTTEKEIQRLKSLVAEYHQLIVKYQDKLSEQNKILENLLQILETKKIKHKSMLQYFGKIIKGREK